MDIHIYNIGQLILPTDSGSESPEPCCDVDVHSDTQLAIRNGRIADSSAASHRKHECQEIDAKGRVVMPGLVDPFWVLPPVPCWVAQASDALLSETRDQLGWGQRLLGQALRNGVTTVEAKCSHDAGLLGLSALGHLEQQRHPRVVGSLLASLPADGLEREKLVSTLIGEVIPEIRQRRLATFCDIGWRDPQGFTSDAKAVLRAAMGAGLRPKIHVQSASESEEIVELATSLGVASISCASNLPIESAVQLARQHVQPVYLPNLQRGSLGQRFRVRALLDQNQRLALGTGNGWTDTSPVSMWSVLRSAMDCMGLGLLEAIWACTLGNAHAMELADEIGTLEVGYRGDLIVLDVADYREISTTQGAPRVSMVLVNGHIAWQA